MQLYDQIQESTRYIQSKWKGTPSVGIILGTGLGGLTQDIQAEATFPYGDIPHFPASTAPSHKGQLVCGKLGGKPFQLSGKRSTKTRSPAVIELTVTLRASARRIADPSGSRRAEPI